MKPGTRIGPYEITSRLGAGGMGEVYRATDTRLRRDVAIKVLPQEVARDGERLARFEREAQVLASLNHPHIGAIYGLEDAGAGPCLVLEHVPGVTLGERIRSGPLPVDEALQYARQMAAALEAAHERGIVHRDLKPDNVKITPQGEVKILDFGLAKALSDEKGPPDTSLSPTLTAAATQAGMILGTAAYMSPEQARGRAVDKRADIWAFGVVLHEMLTGGRLFQGETVSEILAAVLRDQPDLSLLPPEAPSGVRHLIGRCLERDPRQRLRDIGEARIALERPDAAVPPPSGALEAGGPAFGRPRWAWAMAGTLAGAILVALLWALYPAAEPDARVTRALIAPPDGASFRLQADFGGAPILSPDGSRVAFVAVSADRQSRIWVRPLESLSARMIPGTEGAYMPFWSADGRSLGFFTGTSMKQVEEKSGSVLSLAGVTQGKGGAWNEDDVILYAPNFTSPLMALPAGGGDPRQVTTLAPQQTTHRWPQFLPGGQNFIFFAGSHDDLQSQDRGIWWGSLATGESHFVLAADANGHFAAGHLLVVRDGSLVAYPFDPAAGRILGSPRTLGDQVLVDTSTWRINLSASSAGALVYQAAGEQEQELLVWIDMDGKEIGRLESPGSHVSLRLSPTGRYLATETQVSPNSDIWIHDLDKETTFRLTLSEADEGRPVWSPDQREVIFQSNRDDGIYRLYRQPASGSRPEIPVPEGEGRVTPTGRHQDLWPSDWSRDGRFLLVVEGTYGDYGLGRSLSVLDLQQDRERVPLIVSESSVHGRFSPDVRWIAFSQVQNRQENVFVAPFDPGALATADPRRPFLEGVSRWQISMEGGGRPVWSHDMETIYYVRADNTVMAVPLDIEEDSVRVGAARELFVVPMRVQDYGYDLAPDDSRFLFSVQGSGTRKPLVLVTGWAGSVAP